MDVIEPKDHKPSPRLVVYKYEVAGVTYEAAQDVSGLQGVDSLTPSMVGQTASIKFDPKKPMNSIIVCEDWCGLTGINRDSGIGVRGPRESAE